MAEVVTSNAASQLNMLAFRQQAFSVGANQSGDVAAAPPPSQDVQAVQAQEQPVQKTSSEQPSQRETANRDPREQPARDPQSGPSRARVELKHLDFGQTPSEVVGTVDVLQQFDDNGDGRVDLLESKQIQLSRSDGVTFEGLAAAGPKQPELRSFAPDVEELKVAPQTVAPANPDQHVTAKKFYVSPGQPDGQNAGEDKYFGDEQTASLGAPSGSEDVQRKFYGQGAEVVVGQFSSQTAEAAPKYYDKSQDARSQGAFAEDGTGEVKYYDKVAQTETDQKFSGESGGQAASYHAKAEELAALRGDLHAQAQKKYAHAELSAYSDTAGITGASRPVVVVNPTIVTA